MTVDVHHNNRMAPLSQVDINLTSQDMTSIIHEAGLDFKPSPLDLAKLQWLAPSRVALLLYIQV